MIFIARDGRVFRDLEEALEYSKRFGAHASLRIGFA